MMRDKVHRVHFVVNHCNVSFAKGSEIIRKSQNRIFLNTDKIRLCVIKNIQIIL